LTDELVNALAPGVISPPWVLNKGVVCHFFIQFFRKALFFYRHLNQGASYTLTLTSQWINLW
jgi:hypothetical protein